MYSDSESPEMPRGKTRRRYHRGHEALYNQVKNLRLVEKTWNSEGVGKKTQKKLKSTNSELQYNVVYSLDKKKRWRAVNSEDVNIVMETILVPRSRRREVTSSEGDVFKILKVGEKEVVGKEMFKMRKKWKIGKRRRQDWDSEDVEDSEDEDDEEEDVKEDEEVEDVKIPRLQMDLEEHLNLLNLQNLEKPRHQSSSSKIQNSDSDSQLESVSDSEYPKLFDVTSHLNSEGYTFQLLTLKFKNFQNNYHQEINNLREKSPNFLIKDLRENQYLVDISDWLEKETILVSSHLEGSFYHLLINSTIPQYPSKGAEFWKKLLSPSSSLLEAIRRIGKELLVWRKIVQSLKSSASFYGHHFTPNTLNDPTQFENAMINMKWPNEHFHESWTTCHELCEHGEKVNWREIVKKYRNEKVNWTSCSWATMCSLCNMEKKRVEVFLVDGLAKCVDCLRKEFYKELSAGKVPIFLGTETVDEFEYLPVVVPIGVVRFYVKMLTEHYFNSISTNNQSIETCPSCKNILTFKTSTNYTNSSKICPCGYSWCSKCQNAPHWPMECDEYREWWDGKWKWRYTMLHSQGSGASGALQLLQITCQCSEAIFHIQLPTDSAHCPQCKVHINLKTMRTMEKHTYYPYSPVLRHLIRRGFCDEIGQNQDKSVYLPRGKKVIDIEKVPRIRKDVIEKCGAARDARFDEKEHRRIVKVGSEEIGRAMSGAAYLSEMVVAWMSLEPRSRSNRKVMSALEELMKSREELKDVLNDKEALENGCQKMKKLIESVINNVEKLLYYK